MVLSKDALHMKKKLCKCINHAQAVSRSNVWSFVTYLYVNIRAVWLSAYQSFWWHITMDIFLLKGKQWGWGCLRYHLQIFFLFLILYFGFLHVLCGLWNSKIYTLHTLWNEELFWSVFFFIAVPLTEVV